MQWRGLSVRLVGRVIDSAILDCLHVETGCSVGSHLNASTGILQNEYLYEQLNDLIQMFGRCIRKSLFSRLLSSKCIKFIVCRDGGIWGSSYCCCCCCCWENYSIVAFYMNGINLGIQIIRRKKYSFIHIKRTIFKLHVRCIQYSIYCIWNQIYSWCNNTKKNLVISFCLLSSCCCKEPIFKIPFSFGNQMFGQHRRHMMFPHNGEIIPLLFFMRWKL